MGHLEGTPTVTRSACLLHIEEVDSHAVFKVRHAISTLGGGGGLSLFKGQG